MTANDTFAALAAAHYSDVAAHPAEIASALRTTIAEQLRGSAAAEFPVGAELDWLAGTRIELPAATELPRLIELYKRTGRMTGITAGHWITAGRVSQDSGLRDAVAPDKPSVPAVAAAGAIAARVVQRETSDALAESLPVKVVRDLLSLPRAAAVAGLSRQLGVRGRSGADSLAAEVVDALEMAFFQRTVFAPVKQELVDALAVGATTLVTLAEVDSRRDDLAQTLLAMPAPVAALALEQLGFSDIAADVAASGFDSPGALSAALRDAAAAGSVEVRTLRAPRSWRGASAGIAPRNAG